MEVRTFGKSHASLYTLENSHGTKVTLTDIGAAIVSIVLKDKNNRDVDVALGYDSPERYFNNDSSYGAIVGRYANRIGGASFVLNGKRYELDKNEGNNVLHGGYDKYYHRLWYAQRDDSDNCIKFSLISPDGDQGMPGRAQITASYSLDEDNRLVIKYYAVADKDTYFNLTNHCYFNLDGYDGGNIGNQLMKLDCDSFTAIDRELIPTGEIRNLKGTPMDFTKAKPIGRDIDANYEQILLGNGFDHNYILNSPGLDKPFAVVSSPKTGIKMEVYTDLPGVQFYSGNGMGNDKGEKGGKYQRRGGFCLETQYFPDTPNKPQFPQNLFAAGKAFESVTIYHFITET